MVSFMYFSLCYWLWMDETITNQRRMEYSNFQTQKQTHQHRSLHTWIKSLTLIWMISLWYLYHLIWKIKLVGMLYLDLVEIVHWVLISKWQILCDEVFSTPSVLFEMLFQLTVSFAFLLRFTTLNPSQRQIAFDGNHFREHRTYQ